MRYRTIDILNRQLTMLRDEKNNRCLVTPVYALNIVESKFGSAYNIVYNGHGIVLSGIQTMQEANSALSELKALFFVE